MIRPHSHDSVGSNGRGEVAALVHACGCGVRRHRSNNGAPRQKRIGDDERARHPALGSDLAHLDDRAAAEVCHGLRIEHERHLAERLWQRGRGRSS